ncbi:MAG: hypothetical protein M3483_09095 [Gemmatimonadota bacterium]|jgi:hypothetical protein|nr:hypothetical protein [Gemmatimonadota bacterium]
MTIENVSEELYDALKRAAARHRRSLDQQVIVQFEAGFRDEPLDAESFLSKVRGVREQLTGVWLTDELLDEFINKGHL